MARLYPPVRRIATISFHGWQHLLAVSLLPTCACAKSGRGRLRSQFRYTTVVITRSQRYSSRSWPTGAGHIRVDFGDRLLPRVLLTRRWSNPVRCALGQKRLLLIATIGWWLLPRLYFCGPSRSSSPSSSSRSPISSSRPENLIAASFPSSRTRADGPARAGVGFGTRRHLGAPISLAYSPGLSTGPVGGSSYR